MLFFNSYYNKQQNENILFQKVHNDVKFIMEFSSIYKKILSRGCGSSQLPLGWGQYSQLFTVSLVIFSETSNWVIIHLANKRSLFFYYCRLFCDTWKFWNPEWCSRTAKTQYFDMVEGAKVIYEVWRFQKFWSGHQKFRRGS